MDLAELRAALAARDATIVSLAAERDKAVAHGEMLDGIVPPLEEMRREMKGMMLDSQRAMLEAGLPKRQKRDGDIPYYYGANSWQNQAYVPWNEAEKRADAGGGHSVLAAQRTRKDRSGRAGIEGAGSGYAAGSKGPWRGRGVSFNTRARASSAVVCIQF